MNRVTDTLRSQASGARETAEAAGEQLHAMGHQAREMAHDAMDQARESAGELYAQGRERVSGAAASVEQCIRDQPLRSLLVAAGIGCLLGAIWVRR
ncbi:MAG TPA: hypothetical protein VIK18_17910 [Pirellulales bacterium]